MPPIVDGTCWSNESRTSTSVEVRPGTILRISTPKLTMRLYASSCGGGWDGWSAGSQLLPSISGCTFERIIKIVTIPRGRIDKSVTVFLFVHWLQKEAFVT